jgi:(1->4)-alpha-D-glucan 1-alpha-D-glucosylmutase
VSSELPTATYRLQLQPGFGFREAAAAVGYLAELGVSHLYLSPVLQAAPGSSHGYDVVDHDRLSGDLGGESGWAELVATARSAGLGLVVDVVPNHMALPAPEWLNQPLWDVLRLGRASAYAHWFDVDWEAAGDRLVLPLLGEPADRPVLDPAGGPGGEPVLRYHEHAFPLAPGTERLPGPEQLAAQHYRLVAWTATPDELNYRRFFDITGLIAVRVEEPDVFEATHRLLLDKVAHGEIQGLRIDHPDGLADPTGYLTRLADRAGGAWVIVEKILGPEEGLPEDWPVDGTTGYDALNAVTAAFTEPGVEPVMTEIYRKCTGREADFTEVARAAKREAAQGPLRAELRRIAAIDAETASPAALAELFAAWPVYRTYVPTGGPASPADTEVVLRAALDAAAWRPDDRPSFVRWASRVLTGDGEFVTRLQQTTGMVMAKGVEDTAFYRYHRLVALCEVGGDPGTFRGPGHFHALAAHLAEQWPVTMTALTTHDTKRSEDVRARLLVLPECAEEWADAVGRWSAAAAAPEPNVGYLFWQTLVGAWPLERDRAASYLAKAAREAKESTSWTEPDPEFDRALERFCDRVFDDPALLADVAAFVELVDPAASALTLGMKLVQLTMPGVPDVYQETERVYRRLVDPDNRTAPRFGDTPAGLDATKAQLTATALHLRRERPEWFGPGAGHRPLTGSGVAAAHVLSFQRGGPVTVATRLPLTLARRGGWRDTRLDLPDGSWTDALTGRQHDAGAPVGQILAELPVALLIPPAG